MNLAQQVADAPPSWPAVAVIGILVAGVVGCAWAIAYAHRRR